MHSVKVSAKLTIASQPESLDYSDLAAQGFSAVINNRVEGEEPRQPRSADEAAAAKAAGLDYVHIPVMGASFSEADIRAFQDVLTRAEGQVFAHCRSGTRTINLWAAGEVLDGRMTIEDLGPLTQQTGLDLRGAQGWLLHHNRG